MGKSGRDMEKEGPRGRRRESLREPGGCTGCCSRTPRPVSDNVWGQEVPAQATNLLFSRS